MEHATFSSFVKVSTHNGEQRWINLSRVTRISLARDQRDEPVLVFCFSETDRVTVHGSDPENTAVIRRLTADLNELVGCPDSRMAA